MAAILDWTLDALHAGNVDDAMTTLVTSPDAQRAALPREEWRQWIESTARRHLLYLTVQEDPFVGHSATRPRGYPGDAELLDFIYRSPKSSRGSTPRRRSARGYIGTRRRHRFARPFACSAPLI
jgi:hypothetical protein